jgi:tetratricopeptide (TPR) repeat protein
MMQILFVLMALCVMNAHAFFDYDSAASLMEQGKWDEAKSKLQSLLVDKPDAPDVLYDAGVASYKTKDFKQARAYFKKVTELPQTQVQLKEQAHFNGGNSAAALKEYEDAIKQFEMVLNINKSNESAKRNIEKIKELMQRNNKNQEIKKMI